MSMMVNTSSKRRIRNSRRSHRSHRYLGQAGFTLIEVLVVLVVSVIGLIALMSLYNSTVKGNRDASRAREATAIAQRTMEDLRALSVNGIGGLTDLYGALPIEDAQLSTIAGRAGITYKRVFSAHGVSANTLLRLRVVVSWSDSGDDPDVVDPLERHDISLELVRTMEEAL